MAWRCPWPWVALLALAPRASNRREEVGQASPRDGEHQRTRRTSPRAGSVVHRMCVSAQAVPAARPAASTWMSTAPAPRARPGQLRPHDITDEHQCFLLEIDDGGGKVEGTFHPVTAEFLFLFLSSPLKVKG